MNKEKLLAIIAAKEERKKAIFAKAETSNDVEELRSIHSELDSLNGEITELRAIIDAMPDEPAAPTDPVPGAAVAGAAEPQNRGAQPQGNLRTVASAGYGMGINQRNVEKETYEKWDQRGEDLKNRKAVKFEARELAGLFPTLEQRAISLGTSNLVAEQKYSDILIPMFPQVSSLVDLVNAIPLQGGEGYTQGFEVISGEGNYTDDEVSAYNEADPTFDKVSIGKAKITSYTELTDEARKLPNVDYQARVAALMTTSIRKKVAKEILIGTGAVNRLTGIYNAPANVMPVTAPNVDLSVTEIDENTLDSIVYSFGGDEAVEGGQWLILNKADLAAFAAIRSTTGEKLYQIKLQGLVGTISSDNSYQVNFVINSAANPISSANTTSGAYTMAYGSPSSYEMPIFSQIEVMESVDFKFSSGQMAFRADVWLGGNVSKYRGFTRVKKA